MQVDRDEDGLENPLDFDPIEARNAMDDFHQANGSVTDSELEQMISNLNADQKRVFQMVTENISQNSVVLRHFVSGTGGTGKSFLINTLKHWVSKTLNKTVAVSAPTGIAAFNVNGLNIHRLLQLPVEHGPTPKYKPLSDQVLKVLRADLAHVTLLIMDEVWILVTLIFIHLRLMEIFDTSEHEDGWFGRLHLLVFGDLLQLPPVRASPAYENILSEDARIIIGSLGAPNLWKDLFSYDELTINMRQKNDPTFADILTRTRLGFLTKKDQELLSFRLIALEKESISSRLKEITNHLASLPDNTVCLLPTRNMCEHLNIGARLTI